MNISFGKSRFVALISKAGRLSIWRRRFKRPESNDEPIEAVIKKLEALQRVSWRLDKQRDGPILVPRTLILSSSEKLEAGLRVVALRRPSETTSQRRDLSDLLCARLFSSIHGVGREPDK